MYRLLYEDLLKWKDSPRRKPLVLKGVRQCGKTYLLKKFGRENYRNVAYFSFEGNRDLDGVFRQNLDPRRIISDLRNIFEADITPETLIIFDEIQFCNPALTSLKRFREEAPEYHVACAGSLLGVMPSKPLSFPVGAVNFMTLRPMGFYEFLLATGHGGMAENLRGAGEVSDAMATSLDGIYREYLLVGGMPEAVREWAETRDAGRVAEAQREILQSYALDFAKHAPAREMRNIDAIWSSIPSQLARENRRFMFGHAVEGGRARDLAGALQWLSDAGMVHIVRKVEQPSIPLSGHASGSLFKLYGCDVGLMREMSGASARSVLEGGGASPGFRGGIAENFAVTEIAAALGTEMFYWGSKGDAEVDLLISDGDSIVPIEVKSGDRFRAAGLKEYIDRYAPEKAVLMSRKGLREGSVLHLPLGMAWDIGGRIGWGGGGKRLPRSPGAGSEQV